MRKVEVLPTRDCEAGYGPAVDVTFAHEIRHQKHLAQSGRSTRSAVDIINTLRVFTKEPIREQEIKLECMNKY